MENEHGEVEAKRTRIRRPITEEQAQKVMELRKQGWAYMKIAYELNLNPDSVGRLCRENGLGPGGVAVAHTVRDREIAELYQQGYSMLYIESILHHSQRTIRKALERSGVPIRGRYDEAPWPERMTVVSSGEGKDLAAGRISIADARTWKQDHPPGSTVKTWEGLFTVKEHYSHITLLKHQALGYNRGIRTIDLAYYSKFGVQPGEDPGKKE